MNLFEQFAGPIWDLKRKKWISSYSYSPELHQLMLPSKIPADDKVLQTVYEMREKLNEFAPKVLRVQVGELAFSGFMISKNIGVTAGHFPTSQYSSLEEIKIYYTFLTFADAESARAGAWKRAVAVRLFKEHETLFFKTKIEENDIIPLSMFTDGASIKAGDFVAAFGYNSVDDGDKVWKNLPSEISDDILKTRWRPTTSEFQEILHFEKRIIAPGEVLKLDTRDDQLFADVSCSFWWGTSGGPILLLKPQSLCIVGRVSGASPDWGNKNRIIMNNSLYLKMLSEAVSY